MRIAFIISQWAFVVFWLGAAAVGNEQPAFEDVAAATGERYVQLRNQLLSKGIARNAVADAARSNDWRQRGTALALLGWSEHSEKYSRLMKADKVRDRRGRERFVWSTDPQQVDATLLPLAYEFLLKNSAGTAGQEAAARIIPYLVTNESAGDLKVLAGAIHEPELDQQSRVAIARVIANTAGSVFSVADLRKIIAAEPPRNQPNAEVVNWLLNGLVERAAKADQASKREITSWLAESRDVSKLVGRRAVVHTVGALGADSAVPIVAEFLDQADSVADQRWAITSLSKMGTSDEATKAIVSVLTRRKLDPGILMAAVTSLSRVQYSSAVKNVLDEVMRDERLDPAVRRAAYDSLNRQLEANRGDSIREREIRDVLRGVDPATFRKIPGLRQESDSGDRAPPRSRD
jgi:hypothetical protein